MKLKMIIPALFTAGLAGCSTCGTRIGVEMPCFGGTISFPKPDTLTKKLAALDPEPVCESNRSMPAPPAQG